MATSKSLWLVLAGRGVLLLFGLGAIAFAIVATGRPPPGDVEWYACPMHPEATARSAGVCPICGMALQRVSSRRIPSSSGSQGGSGAGTAASFSLEPDEPDVPRHGIVGVARRQFTRRIRGPGWLARPGIVEAQFYDDEAAVLTPGDRGTFVPGDASGPGIPVRLVDATPDAHERSSSTLRFDIMGAAVPPMQAGWVELGTRALDQLVVPAAAIVESPEGPVVLIASSEGRTFTRQSVRVGRVSAGVAVIEAGLKERDRIVAMDAFFLEAAARAPTATETAAEIGP
jgi:hypothetical protein